MGIRALFVGMVALASVAGETASPPVDLRLSATLDRER
jgi:hypothetical protein